MFRVCNDQKEFVRQTKGEKSMWGSKPKIIHAEYITADGKEHHSNQNNFTFLLLLV